MFRSAYFPIPHRPTFGAPVFRSAYSASRNARASAAFAASIKPHRAFSSKRSTFRCFAASGGRGSFAPPLLRTGLSLRDIPVFRSAYFPIPHRPTFGAPVFRSAYSASRNARASAAFAASIKPHRALFFKTLDLQPLRGLRWAGGLRPPCTPCSRPRAAGFFYPDKRWLCAGGRTERQRAWLPVQFLSLEEKRSHSRRGRRRRPLFPHGSCPARGRNHGGTLCTTKPVRTELVFRTHRLYSSGE